MVIQNIARPKIKRTTTKAKWEAMPAKYKKLFKVIDPIDVDTTKEIVIKPSKTTLEKHSKKDNSSDGLTPPPTGEKKKRKKKDGNTNDES